MSETTTVGFAGLGRMGLPMARDVLRAGFPLLVWNRTTERNASLVADGTVAAPEPGALAEADVVITMLTDGRAARSVLVGSGLLERLRPGSVVLEMSTIGPAAVAELARAATQHGVQLLDAPVSGSVSVAEAGQLFAMVGGDSNAYESVAPVLDAMTKGHALFGPSGSGPAMKLAVNAMIAVTNESLAETLVLAERFGIERKRAYDVLAGSVLASPFLLYKREAFPPAGPRADRVHDRPHAQGPGPGRGARGPGGSTPARGRRSRPCARRRTSRGSRRRRPRIRSRRSRSRPDNLTEER